MPVTPARGRQLSLFGVEARPPAPIDLEGLLAGAGEVGRMGGTGRVAIVVDDAWRCAVLRAELELRGLVVNCEPAGEGDRWRLRTSYSAALAPLAARWLDEHGVKVTPRGLALDGRRLRLWVAAAGSYDGQRAYLLRLAPRPLPAPADPEDYEISGFGTSSAAQAADPPSAAGQDPDPAQAATAPPADRGAAQTGYAAAQAGRESADAGRAGVDAGRGAVDAGRAAAEVGGDSADVGRSGRDTDGGLQGADDRGNPDVEHGVEDPQRGLRDAGRGGPDARVRMAARRRDERPNVRKRKSESKITAFDPGPDEFIDAEDFFVADEAVDEWPDSGIGDLPAVELDPVAETESEPEPAPDEGGAGGSTRAQDGTTREEDGTTREEDRTTGEKDGTTREEEGIDRQVADNWIAVGDALAAVGLPAVLVAAESGGPAYRIVGPRRITRLAELVGEPPPGAPPGAWPA